MGILSKPQNAPQIPRELLYFLDSLDGDLICSKCEQIIIANQSEDSSVWVTNHIQSLIAAHSCAGIKFKYDFNDPRTLKEQL